MAKRGGGGPIDLARRRLQFLMWMVRSFRIAALLALSALAACTAVPSSQPVARTPAPRQRARATAVPPTIPAPPPKPAFRAPEMQHLAGLESVIDKDARALLATFGPAALDVREGDMRKLQFAGPACVLDVFLYPLRPGSEPVATYVDARRASDGLDVDRASCIAALKRP